MGIFNKLKKEKKNKDNKNTLEITKEMTLGEVLNLNGEIQGVLSGFGMHCFGCPASQMETIEEAAAVHNIDLDLMLKKLNETLN